MRVMMGREEGSGEERGGVKGGEVKRRGQGKVGGERSQGRMGR